MRTILSTPCTHRRTNKGFTLVEIMVASILFGITALAVTALLIQNFRLAKIQSFRSQTVTTALSVLEQVRFMGYEQIRTIYNNNASGAFTVTILDPSNKTVNPLGYRTHTFAVNVRNGTVVNPAGTTIGLPIDPDKPSVTLPTRYFVSVTRNFVAATTNTAGNPRRDYFEIIITYQWRNDGRADGVWQSGTVRGIIPRRTPWRLGET